MKKYNYKCFVKKNNRLLLSIECYDKEVKKGIEKQLKKLNKYINIEESEIDV